jgi:hypothetical protein
MRTPPVRSPSFAALYRRLQASAKAASRKNYRKPVAVNVLLPIGM